MSPDSSPAEADVFITTCERLSGFSDRVSAEWADGYLTALSAGPRTIGIDEWLPVMCGDAFERCFADPVDAAAARASLAAHARMLARQLEPERLLDAPDAMHLDPLIEIWDEASRAQAVADGGVAEADAHSLVSGGDWSLGFVDAVRDFADDWSPEVNALAMAYYGSLLKQVGILACSDDSPRMAAHLRDFDDKSRPDRDELIDIACTAVQDLRVWWLDHSPKPATVHAVPKPGRNEPCHCGSGKKYKKCHGA